MSLRSTLAPFAGALALAAFASPRALAGPPAALIVNGSGHPHVLKLGCATRPLRATLLDPAAMTLSAVDLKEGGLLTLPPAFLAFLAPGLETRECTAGFSLDRVATSPEADAGDGTGFVFWVDASGAPALGLEPKDAALDGFAFPTPSVLVIQPDPPQVPRSELVHPHSPRPWSRSLRGRF